MGEMYEVKVKVVSQKGHCSSDHKVGDEWVIASKTPQGICVAAFNSLVPNLRTLRFGGTFPWGKDQDVTKVACPDPENPVVFELQRIRK